MNTSQETRGGGNFPISNEIYDLITLIHERAKGIEAIDKYLRDVQGNQQAAQALQQLRQQDSQAVKQLLQLLEQCIHQGAGTTG